MVVFPTTMHTYHSPPEGVCVACEMPKSVVVGSWILFLGQIDEVRREDETEKSNVQRRY